MNGMRPTSNHTVTPTHTSAVRLRGRLAAEFVGTAALLFAIVGSNHSAGRLTDDGGLHLVITAAVTGLVLAAAIAVFQALSGSHFNRRTSWVAPVIGGYVAAAHFMIPSTGFANPAVTVARMFAAGPAGIAPASAVWFVIAQVGAGFIVGAVARNVGRR